MGYFVVWEGVIVGDFVFEFIEEVGDVEVLVLVFVVGG